MSDHYDYGYCDYHDTYHDDVKQAHKKQEPRQPTSEELDEIFWEQQYAVTHTSLTVDAKTADAEEPPRRGKERQTATTGNGGVPAIRRTLWNEKTTRSLLGEDGYAWFVERAGRYISSCPSCKGSGTVMMPAPIGIRRGTLVSESCPSCAERVGALIAFTRPYFETVPPAYRRFTLRTLQLYPPSAVPLEKQAEIITVLKVNPDKGYAFFGPAGTGKTVWATALYSEMLYRQYMRPHPRWNWFPVRRISTKAMLDQHSHWLKRRSNSENPALEPDITSEKITAATKAGQTYRLFLEDMNGSGESPERRAALFDVLNTLSEKGGQLVLTSSLTVAEFKREYGENLFWRIAKHCTVVNLFDEAVKK
jgi:hypothetical protein